MTIILGTGERTSGEFVVFDNRQIVDFTKIQFIVRGNVSYVTLQNVNSGGGMLTSSNIYWLEYPMHEGVFKYEVWVRAVSPSRNFGIISDRLFIGSTIENRNIQVHQGALGEVTLPSVSGLNIRNPITKSYNQAASQSNSTATDVAGLVDDFNALLAKLRTAGIIAT